MELICGYRRAMRGAALAEEQQVGGDDAVGVTAVVASAGGLAIDEVARWSMLWGLPGLHERFSMSFSVRMTRALGRFSAVRKSIRINARLRDGGDLLRETLCHEWAHAAAYELHGPRVRPHGREWASLMRAAGYAARARLPFDAVPPGVVAPAKRSAAIYEHRCPVCGASRRARRPVRNWYCARCLSAGRPGKLEIYRHARHPT